MLAPRRANYKIVSKAPTVPVGLSTPHHIRRGEEQQTTTHYLSTYCNGEVVVYD